MWGGGAGGEAGGEALNGNENTRRGGSGGGASSWAGKLINVAQGKSYLVKVGKGGTKSIFIQQTIQFRSPVTGEFIIFRWK